MPWVYCCSELLDDAGCVCVVDDSTPGNVSGVCQGVNEGEVPFTGAGADLRKCSVSRGEGVW